MPRPRRKTISADLPENVATLIEALRFVSLAQKEESPMPFGVHCRMYSRGVVTTNGMITLGHPIDDDLEACPHTFRFLSSLLRCEGVVQITKLANGSISVKSGQFRSTVNCADPATLPISIPDPWLCALDDRFRAALALVEPLAEKDAARIVLASLLIREGSCVGTTGTAALEAWHGLSLPTMTLPKESATTLLKIDKPLIGFGYSGTSATFYFEGGSFLRTQLFTEQWPDVDKFLNSPCAPVPMPADFWTAIDAIEDFVNVGKGFVNFREGQVSSDVDPNAGAIYECTGIGREGSFDLDLLALFREHMKTADFITYQDKVYFFGEGVRGIVMFARPF